MENLEYLLEQEESLTSKIKNKAIQLKEWFQQKIENVKELLSTTKDKIRSLATKGKTSKKDISQYGIKVGDSASKVLSKIKGLFSELNSYVNNIVTLCKNGISSIMKKDMSKATTVKEKVVEDVKKIPPIITGIAILGSALAAGGAYYGGKKMNDYKETKRKEEKARKDTEFHQRLRDNTKKNLDEILKKKGW